MSKSTFETTRGGFIGMIAAAVAVPSAGMPDTPPQQRHLRPIRALVMCDACRIPFEEMQTLGESLGKLGLEGPIIAVEMDQKSDPIRILNIDGIPRETVEHMIANGWRGPRQFKGDVHHG